MAMNQGIDKLERRPLKELPNNIDRGKRPLNTNKEDNDDDSLDRLLLAQSDLSALIHQIDELVVQAFHVQTTREQGQKEIESFTHFLSEMISSLKPWVPRFKKVLSSPLRECENQFVQPSLSNTVSGVNMDDTNDSHSPEHGKCESLISPSPLVSWRGDFNVERGRQLFVLTPLPVSKGVYSRRQESSKSFFERTINTSVGFNISETSNDNLVDTIPIKPTPRRTIVHVANETRNTLEPGSVFTPTFSKKDQRFLVMTPRIEKSPPRSCVILEDISESCNQRNEMVRKSTPSPAGMKNSSGSQSEASKGLALKYPKLLGIQQTCKLGIRKKLVESPKWFMSPPKSCVIMEPPEEKSLDNVTTDCSVPAHVLSWKTNQKAFDKTEVHGGCDQSKRSCYQEELAGNLRLIESTPMWKERKSTNQTGNRPGENTLKKELWTRFEAATTKGLRLNASVVQDDAQKGFLDLLEEVSE